MKKTINRTLAWLLSVMMVFCVLVSMPVENAKAYTSHSRDEAIAWARSKIGSKIDMDGYPTSNPYQCVDLIKAYYQYLGVSGVSGNGCDYSHNSLPSGWTRIQNTASFVPDPGDIVVWTDEGWKNGHVAIFLSGNTSSFTSIDQNWPQGSEVKEVSHGYKYVWGVIRPDFNGGSSDPIGYFDGVDSPAPNKIHVSGWAFDRDDLNCSLTIDVYIGGVPGDPNAEGYPITANVYRADVNEAYGVGGNRGFDATIPTSKTGTQNVYVYAINIGGGNNVCLGSKTVNIQSDTERPKVSNPVVSEVSENGYRFTCTVSDNVGVTEVKFPTWSGTNWQDDVVWHVASISGNKATAYIKSSDHKGDTGSYYTDIYAYDAAGNVSHDSGSPRTIIPQLKPYVIKYNLNGGSGSFSDQKRYYNGAAIKLNSASPAKTGYSFVGWNTKSDGTGTNYKPNDSYSANADLTLYAIWKANTYTISYNANGGSGTVDSSSITLGQKFTLPGSGFTKAGYTLAGYNAFRKSDNTWCVYNQGWVTESQIKDGNPKKLYGVNGWLLDNSWVNSNAGNDTLIFYAVWTPANPSATTVSVVAGNSTTPTTFSWTKTDNTNTYNLKIYKDKLWDGDAFVVKSGLKVLTCNVELPAGYYEAYVDSLNDNGYTMSTNVVKFTIAESTPKAKGTYNGHTYEYYDQTLTWYQACKFCERKGGHLVTITSKEENDFIVELANSRSGNLWAGGRTNDYKTWYWITGESFDYQNWADGEPNNQNNLQDAIQLYASGQWDDKNSDNTVIREFICEYDSEIDATKYTPVYKENYNGHEYWFFEDSVVWQTAKRICEAKGGYLAVPNDADENSFIISGVKKTKQKETLIGATDITQEGVWKDVKGNSLSYTNWSNGQPDNYLGIEDYAQLCEDGSWNDLRSFVSCFYDIGFVCEFDDLCTGSGHSYTTEIIDPTCTEQGYTLHTCSKCGDSYKDTYTDKLNHEYGEWTITGDKAVHKCKRCGAKETKPLAASITLDRTSVSIEKGKTLTLKAVVAPDNAYSKDISWTSNYNSVAEVKNGVITAKSAGTTAIIASTSNGKIAVCMVTVTEAATNTVKNTSVINSDKVQIGDKVRVSASANGGTAPYTYAYYYKRSTNTAWKTLGTEWGTNSSVAFAPTAEASYDIKVVVKDSAGNKAEKLFTVNAVKELELTNVSVVGRENIKLGTAIPMIGKAVGGSAPYTYSFYFKRSTNTNWKLLGEKFQTTASARFKPTSTGTYDVRIDVKDSSGTIVKKFFTATVK